VGIACDKLGRVRVWRDVVIAMTVDWYARQQWSEELARSIAENRCELAERRERNLIEQVMTPPPVDFSQCKSVGAMSQQQFSAWCDAGKPELPATRAERESRELQRRVAKAAAPVPAPVMDWQAFGEAVGDEIGRAEAQIKRDVDQQIAELRAELRVAIGTIRAEIAVAGDIEQLKREVEALRAERRGLKVVSS
jgi:hypothetical protein